ncbi:MAG TPA: hypothetical protein PKA13_23515 [Geminicoccaceae bacterium]|nr:hypothetical protein [Geminicoccus sp.]HMU52766.1 hypothetical protein [Geminicoccaceae bacterium]
MSRLLGLLVFLLGLAADPADAGDRWPPKAGACDPASWFCAGPRGLYYRGPPPMFGVPSYARPDRYLVPPPAIRPRWQDRPGFRDRRPPLGRIPGPVICDPGRGTCFALEPPPRGRHGLAWRGLDDGRQRLYRPERPRHRHRHDWR